MSVGRWTRITLEVNGESIVATIDGRSEPIVLDPDTTRIPATGGFVFFVGDGSHVELRNVRSKLINSTRDGPF